MDDMMAKLMHVSVGGLLYVGLIQQTVVFMPRLEHLTCYLPGNLALGVADGAVTGSKADRYMEVATNLTYSCWQMYERMPIGRLFIRNPRCTQNVRAITNYRRSSYFGQVPTRCA